MLCREEAGRSKQIKLGDLFPNTQSLHLDSIQRQAHRGPRSRRLRLRLDRPASHTLAHTGTLRRAHESADAHCARGVRSGGPSLSPGAGRGVRLASPVLKIIWLSSADPKVFSMDTKSTPQAFWMPNTDPLHHMAASITSQPQPPSGG